MDCRLCRENIKEYLQNQLPEKSMFEFAYHLTQCPHCRNEVGQTTKMNGLFDNWQAPEPGLGFEARLKARIEAETVSWWSQMRWRLNWQPLAVIGAAAMLLVAGFVAFQTSQIPGSGAALYDLAVVEEAGFLEKLELVENLELFEHWDDIEQMQGSEEG
ncbi:hypothetical protein K8S19_10645 [bacterium]|nr:hypothetical protein [bacterium]